MSKDPKFYGWKLLGVLWIMFLINMSIPLYGSAVIAPYFVKDVQMSRTVLGMGMTISYFVATFFSPVLGMIISKFGVRKVFLTGSALMMVGSVIQYNMTAPWQYLLVCGLSFGLGSSMACTLPTVTSINRWFTKFRGRAMGTLYTASGIGGMIMSPLLQYVMVANGGNWRLACLVGGAFYLFSFLMAFFFVKEAPSSMGQYPDGETGPVQQIIADGVAESVPWTVKEALKTKAFWLIVFGFFASNYCLTFFYSQWVFHLREMGIAPTNAAFCMSVFLAVSVVAKLTGGWLNDKIPSRYVYMLAMAAMCVAALLAPGITTISSAYMVSGIMGIGLGFVAVVNATILANYYGNAIFPQLLGLVSMFGVTLASFAPTIGGQIHDVTNNYNLMFTLEAVLAVVAIVLIFLAKKPEKKEQSEQTVTG